VQFASNDGYFGTKVALTNVIGAIRHECFTIQSQTIRTVALETVSMQPDKKEAPGSTGIRHPGSKF
jgi:hypothetical protein